VNAPRRPPPPRLALSPAEAAASLGMDRSTFYERVLPHLRVVREGRRVLIPVRELESYLERNAAQPLVSS
jgi:excisionase family DNA binding protein